MNKKQQRIPPASNKPFDSQEEPLRCARATPLPQSSVYYTQPKGLDAYLYRSVDSTNRLAKDLAGQEHTDFVVVADEQTHGRGTKNRRFYSPPGSGLYCSYCLTIPVERLLSTTPRAAVASCFAVQEFGVHPTIKWVNDLLLDGRKIAGILTESVVTGETARVIVGIGINLFPTKDIPADLRGIYSTVWQKKDRADHQGILNRLTHYILHYVRDGHAFISDYRRHSAVIGKPIRFFRNGSWHRAYGEAILADGRLAVRTAEGEDILLSEEIQLITTERK